MATVTAITAAAAGSAFVSATINNGQLVLTRRNGETVTVGSVSGGSSGGPTEAWLTGTTDPASTIGVNGDWYLNSSSGKILEKVNGAWVQRIASIIGPQGPQGPQGIQGPAGPTGSGSGDMSKSENLQGLTNLVAARNNLGLGSLAIITPTGTPNGTKYLKDDGSWATPPGTAGLTAQQTRDLVAGMFGNQVVYNSGAGTITLPPSGAGSSFLEESFPVAINVALSDRTNVIPASTTSARASFRAPWSFTLTDIRVTLEVGSQSAGAVDVHRGSGIGTSILPAGGIVVPENTLSVVDAGFLNNAESVSISQDDLIQFYVDSIGSNARGIQVWLIGTRTLTLNTPDAPTNLQVNRISGGFQLSWSAPINAPVTGYIVERSTDDFATVQTAVSNTGNITSVVLNTGMTLGSTYKFRVAAINASATSGGPRTAPSNGVVLASAPTTAPTGVGATAGDNSVTVTWTAVTNNVSNNGYDSITGYTVLGRQFGETLWQATDANNVSSSPATVTLVGLNNVTNGISYEFVVAATNSLGSGAQSASSGLVTPQTGAGGSLLAPTNFRIVSSSNPNGPAVTYTEEGTGVLFRWVNSTSAGVTGYNLQVRKSGTTGSWISGVNNTDPLYDFQNGNLDTISGVPAKWVSNMGGPSIGLVGLINYDYGQYDFRIQATNADGSNTSPWVVLTNIEIAQGL